MEGLSKQLAEMRKKLETMETSNPAKLAAMDELKKAAAGAPQAAAAAAAAAATASAAGEHGG